MNIEFDTDTEDITVAYAEKVWLRMQRKYKPVMDEMEKNRKCNPPTTA